MKEQYYIDMPKHRIAPEQIVNEGASPDGFFVERNPELKEIPPIEISLVKGTVQAYFRTDTLMNTNDKIYIAGHRGMVGAAIVRALTDEGFTNHITATHAELDLTDRAATDAFMALHRPRYVFMAAAKVGGILANDTQGGDFIRDNLLIQTNLIDAAYRNGAQKLMFLGSSCIYPKHAIQPIKEDALLTGSLEETNLPYAVAKIAGKVMCDAYRKQFGFDAFTVMPSNVYGVGDNFDPQSSHVVAGLMRRFHEARQAGTPEVAAWGTGSPMRELIDCDDLADACVFLMQNHQGGGMVNAGSSQEISIKALTEMMAEITGYTGKITWDSSKPDGTPRKIMDNTILHDLGWHPKTDIRTGLEKMFAWFQETGGQRAT